MKEQNKNTRSADRLWRLLGKMSRPGVVVVEAVGGETDAAAPRALMIEARLGPRRPLDRVTGAELAAMRARDWLDRADRTDRAGADCAGIRMRRYRISAAGAAAWRRRRAGEQAREKAAGGAGEAFLTQHRDYAGKVSAGVARANFAESPLAWLARRKGPDGAPFLSRAEVEAGERLRSDFEAAQMGPRLAQDWRRFLASVDEGPRRSRDTPHSPARDRVAAALAALGPGLDDAVFRVCCFLEGLETVEKRAGWSARSGKVVLKIGLDRLVEHYGLERAAPRTGRIEVWRGDERATRA